MVVIAGHRRSCSDVREQFASDPSVFGEDSIGAAQRVCGTRAEVAEIPDRRRDDIKSCC
jgi:hypothetical protein